MKWFVFIRGRLIRLGIVLAALTGFTFLMMRLAPGDPARLVAGLEAEEEVVAQTREDLGLDRPLYEQFLSYVGGIFQGDLGSSFVTKEPVSSEIAIRIGPTLELAVIGMVLILLLGIPLGIMGAVATRNGGRWVEVLFSSTTGSMAAVPQYLVATFLVFLFAVTWKIFPVAGNVGLISVVLPVVAIAIRPAATIARLVRIRTLEVLESQYIRSARSKRLPSWKLYVKHVLPNAVTTVLAMGGLLFAGLVGGAVIVEMVFARPGLGTSLVDAVLVGDYPMVQGIVLLLGAFVVIINAAVDLLRGVVDPQTLETAR
jgi:peptide/nickel transport system permease protein